MTGLRDALQAIYDQHGQLTPELVVEAARPPDSPLHDRLEWDDSKAGESWRRSQASELIRSVRIAYTKPDGKPGEVRGFFAVRTEEGYGYHPTDKAANDPFLTRLALADMEREWKTLRAKYEAFAEFWQLVRDDLAG